MPVGRRFIGPGPAGQGRARVRRTAAAGVVVGGAPRRVRVPRSSPRWTEQTTSGLARAASRNGQACSRIWRSVSSPASSGSNPHLSEHAGHGPCCLPRVDRTPAVRLGGEFFGPGHPGLLGAGGPRLQRVRQVGGEQPGQRRVAGRLTVADRHVRGAGRPAGGSRLGAAVDQAGPAQHVEVEPHRGHVQPGHPSQFSRVPGLLVGAQQFEQPPPTPR